MEMFECIRCQSSSYSVRNLMDDLQGYCTCNECGTHQKLHKEVVKETVHLYTPKDVQKVREQLLKEQKGCDKLTGLKIPPKQAVTDHNHQTQFVRGVLHRQSNVVLGKIENLWTRYLSYWYEGTLADFLRQAADYIEKPDDTRFVHPGWLKKSQTMFNSLSEGSKKAVLGSLGQTQGGNGSERKILFKKALMTRQFTFEEVQKLIQTEKEKV